MRLRHNSIIDSIRDVMHLATNCCPTLHKSYMSLKGGVARILSRVLGLAAAGSSIVLLIDPMLRFKFCRKDPTLPGEPSGKSSEGEISRPRFWDGVFRFRAQQIPARARFFSLAWLGSASRAQYAAGVAFGDRRHRDGGGGRRSAEKHWFGLRCLRTLGRELGITTLICYAIMILTGFTELVLLDFSSVFTVLFFSLGFQSELVLKSKALPTRMYHAQSAVVI